MEERRHKSFYRNKWFKYGLITAIVAAIIYFMFFQGKKQEYVLAEAVKGDIIQTVSVTGSIKADPSLNLHFKKTGTVGHLPDLQYPSSTI
jgi:multidrug efflux pump subunit AcrA (membrane-fusion protein)